MLTLTTTNDGVVILIAAKAGGRVNAVRGVHDGHLKVSVTTAPERGKANAAILALLAEACGVKPHQLTLLAGETSPRKKVLVRGVTADEVRARLADGCYTRYG
ncbi:MAG: DUF167 domain-containing protein [Thermoguttaceae bacterium]